MSVSQKYKTFDQLMDEVKIDFRSYNLEGHIENQQLIKVAQRVNYDLGLKIQRTHDLVIDVENGKAKLPSNFHVLNFGAICGKYTVNNTPPSGTHTESTTPIWTPDPSQPNMCVDPANCKDVCVVTPCSTNSKKGTTTSDSYIVVQYVGAQQWREYSVFLPLRIGSTNSVQCDCPNLSIKAADTAEIKDGYLLTNFNSGKVYINYQGELEDASGRLLVLDHPYCNEYYEYAIKQRILENMVFDGENVVNQLGLIEQKYKAARNTALGFVNTPDFAEYRKIWEVNRRAQYHNYYDMFRSNPPLR
jgi:hypothetical protein|tara:strand:+ start:643 stop:1551 length:909 start_codon:yes stop_codon:yes gene_type:complete